MAFGRTPPNDPFESVSAAFSDVGGGIDVASVVILLDGGDVTHAADVMTDGFDLVPPEALSEGIHELEVRITDLAGNGAAAQTFVEVDLTLPPAPVVEEVDRTTTHVTLRGPSPPDVVTVEAWADQADVESAEIEPFTVVFRKTDFETFLSAGDSGSVAYVHTTAPGRLDRLASFGLVPGSKLHVHQTWPSVVVLLGETEFAFDRETAEDVFVRKSLGSRSDV